MKGLLVTKRILKGVLALVIVLVVIYFLLAIYTVATSNFGVPRPVRHSYDGSGEEFYSNAIGWEADSGRGRSEIYVGFVQNEDFGGLTQNFCLGLSSVSNVDPANKNCLGVYLEAEGI